MSRNFGSDSISQASFVGFRINNVQYENRIIISSNTNFVVPPNTKAIKFSAVGGGRPAVANTGGPGGGYFEKTFYAPFTGIATSFQLTVGAVGGNTVLANSAGTTIATAFGATAIGPSFPVGVGGTASGGDVNSNGSPGGTVPGCGGASGGCFGDGQYNPTYAGRWVYLKESLTNDNVKNFMLQSYYINGGQSVTGTLPSPLTPTAYFGTVYSTPFSLGSPGGLFANGADGSPSPSPLPANGGFGGYGGDGGAAAGPGGLAGQGGIGGNGGTGAAAPSVAGTGGAGGFGGNGGDGGLAPQYGGSGGPGGFGGRGGAGQPGSIQSGAGGAGGFGGGGGKAGGATPGGPGINPGGAGGFGGGGGGTPPQGLPGAWGQGGAGAFIVEWTTSLPNKTGV